MTSLPPILLPLSILPILHSHLQSTFKQGLVQCFAAQDKGCVMFERNTQVRGQQHMHIQVIPMMASLMSVVKGAFLTSGSQCGMQFVDVPSIVSTQQGLKDVV